MSLLAASTLGKQYGARFLFRDAEFTLSELAETVLRITGSKSEVVHEALPIDDPQVRQPDITRAKQLLGWEPEVQLEEGLRRMLPSFGREPVIA